MPCFKWLLLGIACVVGLTGPGKAQDKDDKLHLGAHFGVAAAGLQGSAVPTQAAQAKAGLTFGLEASFPFQNSPFAVLPGLVFNQKGARVKAGRSDYNINLEYLSIPVLGEVTFGEKWVFFSQMGPYVAFLQQARREGTVVSGTNPFTGETTTNSTDQSIRSGVRNGEIGLNGALGLRFPFFNGQLGLRLGFSRGLTPVDKPSATGVFQNGNQKGDIYNRVVNVRLQYRLPLTAF